MRIQVAVTARDQQGARETGRSSTDVPSNAIVDGVWTKGYFIKAEAQVAETEMRARRHGGVRLAKGRVTVAEFIDAVWWPMIETTVALNKPKATPRRLPHPDRHAHRPRGGS